VGYWNEIQIALLFHSCENVYPWSQLVTFLFYVSAQDNAGKPRREQTNLKA